MARGSKHLPGPRASSFALPRIFAVALALARRAVAYISFKMRLRINPDVDNVSSVILGALTNGKAWFLNAASM